MKLTLTEFSALTQPVAVTIHSLDRSLYQITATVDGTELLVVEDDGQTCSSRNLQSLRDILQILPVSAATLRQVSAYDEFIGQPAREGSNALEVPFDVGPIPD
jgi:hypothetical protein